MPCVKIVIYNKILKIEQEFKKEKIENLSIKCQKKKIKKKIFSKK